MEGGRFKSKNGVVHLPPRPFKPICTQNTTQKTKMNRFFKDVRTIERMQRGPWVATSPSMAINCTPRAIAESHADESYN